LNLIKINYQDQICSDIDPLFWEKRTICQYATLLHIKKAVKIDVPFFVKKKDRRGWVILKTKEHFNLFKETNMPKL
jgi:hypothetical protein